MSDYGLAFGLQALDDLVAARKAQKLAAEQQVSQRAEHAARLQAEQTRRALDIARFNAEQEERAANRLTKQRGDVTGMLQSYSPTEAIPDELQQQAQSVGLGGSLRALAAGPSIPARQGVDVAALGGTIRSAAPGAPSTAAPSYGTIMTPEQRTYMARRATPQEQAQQNQAAQLQAFVNDPNTPEHVRAYVRAQAASGDTSIPAALFQPAPESPEAKDARALALHQKTRLFDIQHPTRAPQEAAEPIGVHDDARLASDGHTRYLDLSLYTGKERSQARREAHAAGIIPLGKEDAAAVQEAQNALANLDFVDRQITGHLPKDASGRVMGGLTNKLSSLAQANDILAAAGSLRATAINSLRAAAGSKGFRMTEAEIALAVENDIPRITDTVGVAQQKLNNMRQLIRNAEAAHLGNAPRATATGANPGTRLTARNAQTGETIYSTDGGQTWHK